MTGFRRSLGRAVAVGFALAATTAGAGPTRAETPADPLAGLRSATNCRAWSHVVMVRTFGRRWGGGLVGTFSTVVDARSGRYVTRARIGPFAQAEGDDGGVAWVQDFSGGSHRLNAASARARARTAAWLRAHGWCAHSGARYSAQQIASTRSQRVVRVVPAGGAAVLLSIDSTTHLLGCASMQFDEYREDTYFEDWRAVGEVAVPFVRRVVDEIDHDVVTYASEGVSVSAAAAAPSAFAQPTNPPDVTLPRGASAVRVPYIVDGDKPIVRVRINGVGPFPFVLDTGGHFILTAETARTLRLRGVGAASSVNQNRVTKVGYARVRETRIGQASIRDQVAKIVPYGFAKLERGPRPPKAGWLGMQLLERLAVTFDPRTHEVTLRRFSRGATRPAGVRLPLYFDEDAPLAECAIAGAHGLCMLDTGNAGPTIVPPTWAAHHGLAPTLMGGFAEGSGVFASRTTVALGPFARGRARVEYAEPTSSDAERSTLLAGIFGEHFLEGFVTTYDVRNAALYVTALHEWKPEGFTRTGIVASKRPDGDFLVVGFLPQSPGASSHLRRGDVVTAIDGQPSRRLSAADFARMNAKGGVTSHILRIVRGNARITVRVRATTLLP